MLNLQKYSGKLVNFSRVMSEEEFIIQDIDRNVEAASILVTALAGLGGMAASQLHARSGRGEKADYVVFELNGISFSGWLWACPFQNGDEVEVVAAQDSKGQQIVYAIARPKDRLIATYPHSCRGTQKHWTTSLKTYLKVMFLAVFFLYGLTNLGGFAYPFKSWQMIGFFICGLIYVISFLIGLIFLRTNSKKRAILLMSWPWFFLLYELLFYGYESNMIQMFFTTKAFPMHLAFGLVIPLVYPPIHWYIKRMERFSKLTEQILTCLGESNVQEADLVKLSKSTPLDPSSVAIAEKYNADKEYELSIEMHYGSKFFRY